ncbi:predicted protein [Histoplasma capsulatum G186AR]|uniref:Uncharacterized protein n=1 Tax=Ajellomyces capsulatus (strain G186AR / H82 / ATCC MYA-2454 / RMSCC 2432) TaxID=447093 RepID=C0NXH4_AJECG|nr:uncharacterized protein HCBG_08166 [Histoplasma capsulatum G186AR]EEH04040.1 predicted protein [Histoplasma capsulatum G186AR]
MFNFLLTTFNCTPSVPNKRCSIADKFVAHGTASEQCPPRLRCINPIRGNLGASNAGERAPTMQPCNHGWQAAAEGPKPPTDGLVFGLAMLGAFYELLQLPSGGLERLQCQTMSSSEKGRASGFEEKCFSALKANKWPLSHSETNGPFPPLDFAVDRLVRMSVPSLNWALSGDVTAYEPRHLRRSRFLFLLSRYEH